MRRQVATRLMEALPALAVAESANQAPSDPRPNINRDVSLGGNIVPGAAPKARFVSRKPAFAIALLLALFGGSGTRVPFGLLPSPAMAADLNLIIRPTMRMTPLRTDRPASASSCAGCLAECGRRGAGPVCEAVCREVACRNR